MHAPRRSSTVLALVALTVVGGSATARAAAPTTTVTLEDAWTIRADDRNELAAFVNISRAAFCTPAEVAAENAFLQWVADGAIGDPPNDYPYVASSVPLVMTVQEVARGNLRASGTASVPVELWTFEEGKSFAAGNLASPCLDTDGIVDLTDELVAPGMRFATGTGTYALRDNDWSGAGPRTNVWSESLAAKVSGDDGAWSYSYTQDNLARAGEYLKGATTFRLKAR